MIEAPCTFKIYSLQVCVSLIICLQSLLWLFKWFHLNDYCLQEYITGGQPSQPDDGRL